MGAWVPFYAGKIDLGFDQIFHGKTSENPVARKAGLKKRPVEYYKMLYADTSLNGSVSATRCGHDFFTTAIASSPTDAPFDAEQGRMLMRETIKRGEQPRHPPGGEGPVSSPATRAHSSS